MVRLVHSLLLVFFCIPTLVYADGPPTNENQVQFRTQVSSTTVWERQQITMLAKVTTPDRFATLIIDTPKIEGFEIYTIPHSREQHSNGNHILRTGWILFPLQPGTHNISLPAVNYRLGGAIQQTFGMPGLKIQVKALPPYIPPTIPVGKVSIHNEIEPENLLKTDHLSYWHITLQGMSVPPVWLPPILRHIKSSSDVQFLSASSERTTTPDTQGVHGKVVHHIPLKPLSNGQLSLPTIQFQYFDPENGRIETIKYKPGKIIALSTTLRFLLAGVFSLLIFVLLRRAFMYFQIRLVQQRARNYALGLVSQAQDETELRHALRRYATAEGWPENLALSRWMSCYKQHYVPNHQLPQIIDNLSQIIYGQANHSDIGQIRNSLVHALTTAKKIKHMRTVPHADQWAPEAILFQRKT